MSLDVMQDGVVGIAAVQVRNSSALEKAVQAEISYLVRVMESVVSTENQKDLP